MDPDEAAKLYLRRMDTKIPTFETMNEKELNYIKMINAGQKFFYNNVSFNYLSHRIVFYLTNTHIKTRATYFVRAGAAQGEESYKADAPLSEEGIRYARVMAETLIQHREQEHAELVARGRGAALPMRPVTVWCSARARTVQTADAFQERGFVVRHRTQMSQINPGVCERLSERAIRRLYPEEISKHELDPYHHRYPRAESYHDLAVRLEPIILELEREQHDLVIIAHESVLRVLYAYLMHCSTRDIPKLTFPRDEIIEIIPAAYQNEAKRIHSESRTTPPLPIPLPPAPFPLFSSFPPKLQLEVREIEREGIEKYHNKKNRTTTNLINPPKTTVPGLDPRTVPGSPEDIRIPVPESGADTPTPLPDPAFSPAAELKVIVSDKPPEKVINTAAEAVRDKIADED